MANDSEHFSFSVCLLAIYISSFLKCPCKFLPLYFWVRYLSYYYLIITCFILGASSLSDVMCYKYFFPIYACASYFLVFFRKQIFFYFSEVQFTNFALELIYFVSFLKTHCQSQAFNWFLISHHDQKKIFIDWKTDIERFLGSYSKSYNKII